MNTESTRYELSVSRQPNLDYDIEIAIKFSGREYSLICKAILGSDLAIKRIHLANNSGMSEDMPIYMRSEIQSADYIINSIHREELCGILQGALLSLLTSIDQGGVIIPPSRPHYIFGKWVRWGHMSYVYTTITLEKIFSSITGG